MAWKPEENGLNEVMRVLRDSTSSENPEVQKEMTVRLHQFNEIPEYPCYLVYILNLPEGDERLRAVAGLLLKNNASTFLSTWAAHVLQYVKSSILVAFVDASPMVRNAAGQVVVSMLDALEPANWPEVLSHLLQSLDAPSLDVQLAALSILQKACDDYPRKFDIVLSGNRPLDFMIPKFISLAEHPNSRIRTNALMCVAHFIQVDVEAMRKNMDAFISSLFRRASDENPDVRQQVCQCLVMLLGVKTPQLIPAINDVATFMLYSTQDRDENVALEACEFWLTFAEEEELQEYLRPLLPKLAPVLLQCMVYSEEDLMWLQGDDEDDSNVPDKPSDIKPKFYGGASRALGHQDGDGQSTEDNLDDDDDYDDYDDDDMSTDWNIRKCAAAALDVLAVRFGADLLQVIFPHLKEKLWSEDWLQKESGILALGAMAEGCIDALEEHLPALIPYLCNALNDQRPLVRSIVCWTLGRYASWCATSTVEGNRTTILFRPWKVSLLRMVLDNNKRVQEAGCSAFATFEEDAGPLLEPYLEPILRNLVFAFERYQQKNLLILYDAVGTLADAVGDALSNKEYVDILMPPLITRWQRLNDDDDDLIPLLECLSSVTMACGKGFVGYAPPVFERANRIVHDQLVQYQSWQQERAANPDTDEPDKTFLIVALDLLSGLAQGLGPMVRELIVASNPPLMPLIAASIKHPEASVRQSAYALIGDVAISVPDLLRPSLGDLMPQLLEQISPEPKHEFISACNNAAWSVGEIALNMGQDPEFNQWIPALIDKLIPILLQYPSKSPKSLVENAAVTIGRIALVQPQIVAPHLSLFASQWCQALWEIKDNSEKDTAFRGFCAMIELNPTGIQNHFIYFCNAVSKWTSPSPELEAKFLHIFTGFKQMLGAQWDGTLGSMPPPIPERIRERYQV
ncbi:armadillo-type protein [Cantharellus anzutake]|uniref:armadillo-type protein n=1 Tax=Cantharellus anzutake TaxID=1750568 RepID=UPI001903AA4D|nr:armadillo-type protein [Cantharellus anzutake]KAF8331346.1 armadillo-type protein [Cantharellus anzutake]